MTGDIKILNYYFDIVSLPYDEKKIQDNIQYVQSIGDQYSRYIQQWICEERKK